MQIIPINWKNEFNNWRWYGLLQDKINRGDFRLIANTGLHKAFLQLEARINVCDTTHLKRFVEYINMNAEKDFCELPFEERMPYWVRVNGKVLAFELIDEYQGQGSYEYGVAFTFIDLGGADDFWLNILGEIENGVFPNN